MMRRSSALRKPPRAGALHAQIKMLGFDHGSYCGARNLNRQCSRLAWTILFSLTLSLAASAETVAQIVRDWGLIGSWSRDCSLEPGRNQNTLLAYETMGDGRVVHRRDFGNTTDENEVVGAEVSADSMLNLRVFFPNFKQTREYGLMKQPDGSVRTMYNHDQNDEYSIRDGNFTANGNPTPALHKCR
jgi:hypothetical protein